MCVWTLPTTFQSTPSAWRETAVLQSPLYGFYISIHSLRMEGDPLAQRAEHNPAISIHSLRMEGDVVDNCTYCPWRAISIHSLRMEGDLVLVEVSLTRIPFQSTPSAWRETELLQNYNDVQNHFNPLPPHGGRLSFASQISTWKLFQSTPSAWRETAFAFSSPIKSAYFNPLPPHGGRHTDEMSQSSRAEISIHSLRMEGDLFQVPPVPEPLNFNPLPPHGGRRIVPTAA